jgi:hypothetical protein
MMIEFEQEIKMRFIDLVRLCEDVWNYANGTKGMDTFVFNYLYDTGILEDEKK